MNSGYSNVRLVESVAESLGSLRDHFVFVGGCAAGLLITDPARPPVRATTDVDLVVEVATRADYYALRKDLLAAGFRESGDLICRWTINSISVDIMPTRREILGFENPWYEEAVRTALPTRLPSGAIIRLIAPPLFLATKLEAFHSRGHEDFAMSHDMEDIITVVDGRPELPDEVANASPDVQTYLESEIAEILEDPAFLEAVPWHFRSDEQDQARVPIAISRLRRIARI